MHDLVRGFTSSHVEVIVSSAGAWKGLGNLGLKGGMRDILFVTFDWPITEASG